MVTFWKQVLPRGSMFELRCLRRVGSRAHWLHARRDGHDDWQNSPPCSSNNPPSPFGPFEGDATVTFTASSQTPGQPDGKPSEFEVIDIEGEEWELRARMVGEPSHSAVFRVKRVRRSDDPASTVPQSGA